MNATMEQIVNNEYYPDKETHLNKIRLDIANHMVKGTDYDHKVDEYIALTSGENGYR